MWYLVLSRTVRAEAMGGDHTPAHRDWLDDQHRAGKLLFSGPITDGSYGVYVILAGSKQEAEQLAAQDPYHVHGDREMQVWEWNAHRAFRLDGPSIAELEEMARNPRR